MKPKESYDVAIIGGGPAGSTTGTILKKYDPGLRVAIFERETFPRDHVGESLLPPICGVLDEMGCWDKIEAADFPIKIGATYRWGKSPELWDFDFLAGETYVGTPRPAKYEGQRRRTTWQVDRAVYDDILLKHAAEAGCEIRQPERVLRVHRTGDRVTALELEDGSNITAEYYIDGSGHSGILRRAMGVESEAPTTLQNVAIWDYWQNAEWAVHLGVGGTRVYVISLGYGWIWFIPIGPTRTSIGLVLPAAYYKQTGMKPAELYQKALGEDPLIVSLLQNAVSENRLQTTKDWSFVAERICGENWFLVGESAGFADPILAAGLTMTHLGGREAAYTILELRRGENEPAWLREQFNRRQRDRVITHIRFADYWYTANTQFKDLKDFSSELAKDVGLELNPEDAWAWLAQGGFISQENMIGIGGFSLDFLKQSADYIGILDAKSPLERFNVFKLNLQGAELREVAVYRQGRVAKRRAYARGERFLPLGGPVDIILLALQEASAIEHIHSVLRRVTRNNHQRPGFMTSIALVPEIMEAMIHDGWIEASYDSSKELKSLIQRSPMLRWNKPGE